MTTERSETAKKNTEILQQEILRIKETLTAQYVALFDFAGEAMLRLNSWYRFQNAQLFIGSNLGTVDELAHSLDFERAYLDKTLSDGERRVLQQQFEPQCHLIFQSGTPPSTFSIGYLPIVEYMFPPETSKGTKPIDAKMKETILTVSSPLITDWFALKYKSDVFKNNHIQIGKIQLPERGQNRWHIDLPANLTPDKIVEFYQDIIVPTFQNQSECLDTTSRVIRRPVDPVKFAHILEQYRAKAAIK